MVVKSLGIVLTILVITIQVHAWYKLSRYQKEIDKKHAINAVLFGFKVHK